MLMRAFVAAALGAAAGIFGFAAGAGLTGSWYAATLIAVVAAGLIAALSYRRPIVTLDETACTRGLKTIAVLATLVALVQLARLAVFTVDASQVGYSAMPGSAWELGHSCLSAYFVAGQAASTTPNIYDDSLYTAPDDDLARPRKALPIGTFKIDVFEYPPPFLLLPRALMKLTPEFLRLRMLWFALYGSVVLLAMLVTARFLGPAAGMRALLLAPIVWASLPSLSAMQKGNVQAMVIAAAMLAMVLFEKRRWAAGGALLAFVTLSKLYPGLLLVYLLARRQWRALAWTAACGAAFLLVSLADTGWAPYAAFVQHLPGLVGGEAFPAFRNPAATAINYSIPGLVFKAKLFGVPGMSFASAKIVGWAYTLVAAAVTAWAGLRALRKDEQPLIWMAILILATLRSPFLPQAYAAIPPLWLLTLLAATLPSTARRLTLTLLAAVALNIYWPTDWAIDPRWLAILTSIPQTATVALAVVAFRRRPEPGAIVPSAA
jgi:hypothetical protein